MYEELNKSNSSFWESHSFAALYRTTGLLNLLDLKTGGGPCGLPIKDRSLDEPERCGVVELMEGLIKRLEVVAGDARKINDRFRSEPARLKVFYNQLERIEKSKTLTRSEKDYIQAGIVRDVASPSLIRQRRTANCGAVVTQQTLAIRCPDKYAKIFADACCDLKVNFSDGSSLDIDLANATAVDQSRRALHSRLFHYIANNAAVSPGFEFRNSSDGFGRIYPVPFRSKIDRPYTFNGLNMQRIALMSFRLTGERKGIALLSSIDSLVQTFRINGERPMPIMVNAESIPFGSKSPSRLKRSDDVGQHIVLVVGIDKGVPPRVRLHNSYGAKADHSTPSTALKADILIENASMPQDFGLGGPFQGTRYVKVIVNSEKQGAGYLIKDKRLKLSAEFTNRLRELKGLIPGPVHQRD
jgi:hypothetical protein